jgi:hypothetical protein
VWIMVSGPYRTGAKSDKERAANLGALNVAALTLFHRGHVPLVAVNMALPLLEAAKGASYEQIMLPLSRSLAERCDAIVRLDGESSHADLEVARVRASGGQVYRSTSEVPETFDSE